MSFWWRVITKLATWLELKDFYTSVIKLILTYPFPPLRILVFEAAVVLPQGKHSCFERNWQDDRVNEKNLLIYDFHT
jgi:hypothetical protein